MYKLVTFYYESENSPRRLRFVSEERGNSGYIAGIDLEDGQYKQFIASKATEYLTSNLTVSKNARIYSLKNIFVLAGVPGAEVLFDYTDKDKVTKYLSEKLDKNVTLVRENHFLVDSSVFDLYISTNDYSYVLTFDAAHDKVGYSVVINDKPMVLTMTEFITRIQRSLGVK